MFTRIQSRAFVMVSLGLVAIGNSLNSQSVTPAAKPSQDNKIQLSYHVKAIKRDSAGQYTMSGTVNGELQGRATLVFGFDEGSVEVVSGQTHLVGKITEGAHKGRRVETTSRVLDFGPYGSLSDIDGNMIIDGK